MSVKILISLVHDDVKASSYLYRYCVQAQARLILVLSRIKSHTVELKHIVRQQKSHAKNTPKTHLGLNLPVTVCFGY